jgi:hypothetical protein
VGDCSSTTLGRTIVGGDCTAATMVVANERLELVDLEAVDRIPISVGDGRCVGDETWTIRGIQGGCNSGRGVTPTGHCDHTQVGSNHIRSWLHGTCVRTGKHSTSTGGVLPDVDAGLLGTCVTIGTIS